MVFLLSGKRKSGKDFIASKLLLRFGEEIATIIRLSGPLKAEYARMHSLDFDRLLEADSYKESHRQNMITWGEQKRVEDPTYFCRLATEGPWIISKKVWIISDARRGSDLEYFRSYPNVITIRVVASESSRIARGFSFVDGIDDADSECGLDDVKNWDYIFDNSDGPDKDVEAELDNLIDFVDQRADSVGDADIKDEY